VKVHQPVTASKEHDRSANDSGYHEHRHCSLLIFGCYATIVHHSKIGNSISS
jgi:hypothetical protein